MKLGNGEPETVLRKMEAKESNLKNGLLAEEKYWLVISNAENAILGCFTRIGH